MDDKEIITFAGPYFKRSELECHCGCGALPTTILMLKLKILREICGPLVVTSAMRCPTYNKKVANTGLAGPHTTGMAVDLHTFGEQAGEIISRALELDVAGIGVCQIGTIANRYLHLDWTDRPYLTVWSY